MPNDPLILSLEGRTVPKSIGNKAINLHRLSGLGLLTPKTYAIPWEVYQRYTQDDGDLVDELRLSLGQSLDPEKTYAVRSSANIEDGLDSSFAGQFESVLNASGIDGVIRAVYDVWASSHSPRVESYLAKHDIPSRNLLMGVIVQEMVEPVFGGVALSRNPVTGADEVVVEAVKGSGEAVVQAGITPNRWVNKWGAWIIKPSSNEIPLSLIEEVVEATRQIARDVDSFVDLEWVFDGTDLYWLQVREITAINRHNVYSNHISKEFIPGIIKPLIGSINIPLVCSMWLKLVTEMVGKTGVQAKELAKSFYYRVYFNMGTLGQLFKEVGMPADSVETLMGLVPDDVDKPGMKPTLKTFLRLPWLLRFLVDKWFFAFKLRRIIPKIERDFNKFKFSQANSLKEAALLTTIDDLYDSVQGIAYYNIIVPLLAMVYNRLLKSQLSKHGVDLLEFDLMSGVTELHEFDPNFHLRALYDEYCQLDEAIRVIIRESSYTDFLELSGIAGFKRNVAAFLDRFGHLSDNGNDFSFTPWRETPDVVLDMIVNFLPPADEKQEKFRFEDLKLQGFNRWLVGLIYHRAQEFHLMREQISSHYTYGYGLFRYYYLALGSHLASQGRIAEATDVFYLEDAEIRALLRNDHKAFDANQLIRRHKVDIERFNNITLPGVIYGDDAPPVADPSHEKLVGIPTSIGHYTGKVTVVRGIQDFIKVQQGDVLVIPYSEVSWTPLFARAGAVVAESGGMLSHSSIVAREYNIPAVVSVDGAMGLRDETVVTVNGHNGEIIIHNDGHHIENACNQEK